MIGSHSFQQSVNFPFQRLPGACRKRTRFCEARSGLCKSWQRVLLEVVKMALCLKLVKGPQWPHLEKDAFSPCGASYSVDAECLICHLMSAKLIKGCGVLLLLSSSFNTASALVQQKKKIIYIIPASHRFGGVVSFTALMAVRAYLQWNKHSKGKCY